MHEHITSLMQIQSGVCLFPAVFASYVCACVSPCFDSPGPPPENSKGLFILHLAFSSIITTELWSHHELHTYSLLHAHVYAHIRQINMYSFTHDDTPTRSNPHAQNPAHIPPSRGITVQSQPLFLRGKTCFFISFHFFRLCYLSPSPLPPSAFSLSNM